MNRGVENSKAWRATGLGMVILCGIACGGSDAGKNLSYGENARASYSQAMEDLKDENCLDAEPAFRKVAREFPYSRYAALAELRVGDCLFDQGKFPEAIAAFRRFVRSRPSHPEIPYARFKVAESYFRQVPDDWLLAPPAHERDQGPAKEALQQLRRFIVDYPDDKRVGQAEELSRKVLTVLARHELYVAEFYLDEDHPRAAIGRLQTLLEAYGGSGIEPQAMLLLGRTYLELRDRVEARRAFQELLQRYPRSGYARQAQAYLEMLGSG